MVSPRIWVGCAAGNDSQQGMALTQQLISDLQKAGVEVVSESSPLSDEQFLPFLQQELASCQWFILVQTPQGMGSKRVQHALQEAHTYLKAGSLRGACLISVSSEGWGDSAPWPEIRLYTRIYAYNGDYLRLRDKLLLDLGLLQITGMLQFDAKGDATVRTPPVQKAPGFQPQTSGSAEQPVLSQEALDLRPQAFESIKQPKPFQGYSEDWYQPSPSLRQPSSFSGLPQTGSMASLHGHKTGRGDRPVAAPLFTMPRLSRRFWLYSAVSLCVVALVISSAILANGMASAFTPSAQSTPITLTHSTPTHPVSTQPAPAQPAPTQPPPGQPASGQPAPTQPAPGQPAPTQPAPPACPPQIGPGSTGYWVQRAQSDLNSSYASGAFPNSPYNFNPYSEANTPLKVDGILGTDTTNATKDFQTLYAQPVDGIIGPVTWAALGECS